VSDEFFMIFFRLVRGRLADATRRQIDTMIDGTTLLFQTVTDGLVGPALLYLDQPVSLLPISTRRAAVHENYACVSVANCGVTRELNSR